MTHDQTAEFITQLTPQIRPADLARQQLAATRRPAPAAERNPTVEAWIKSFGVESWEFLTVALTDIDRKTSHANQARFKPLDEMTVKRYGLAASAGAKFPPIVLALVGHRFVTIDGNHRVDGLQLGGIHQHPAYVIQESETKRQIMTATANVTNGLPLTEDEVRTLALDIHSRGAMTIDQIAVLTGLSPSQIGVITRASAARQRASNPRTAMKINDNDMEIIGRASSDAALNMLVAVTGGGSPLPQKELAQLVKSANKEHSDTASVRVIEDFLAAKKGARAKPSAVVPDAAKLTRALGAILNCNPTAVGLATPNRQEILNKIDETIDRLAEISEALA